MNPAPIEGEVDGSVDAVLRECPGCGLFQIQPVLTSGTRAQCERCGTGLTPARRHPLQHSLALSVAALVLLTVMCLTTLMTVRTAGIEHQAGIFSGPVELVARDMAALGIVVAFVTVAAPLTKVLGTIYILLRIREPDPPRHLRSIFVWVERLSTWSMIEVFVLGVFVAYVKLGDIVQIEMDAGVYALLALTIVIVWADAGLDRQAIWAVFDTDHAPETSYSAVLAGHVPPGAVGCETCTLVVVPDEPGAKCPRCGSHLHHRKPESLGRTWALLIAAVVCYVPANLFPVLTVMQLGVGAPSTILGGVEELLSSGMYPLAGLVFFASIAVPMLKMVGLSVMLVSVQLGHTGWLRDRTRLYYIIHWIGRWSMIDIFMEALLGALVQFGGVVTIEPGIGAVAFCAVVVLTIFAAETFDPRTMWDAAEGRSTVDELHAPS